MWASIGSDGNIYPCGHVSTDGMESYGNILEQNLSEIWNGEKRKKVLKSMPNGKCRICSPASLRRNALMSFLSELDRETQEELINEVQ